jgi:hypothetical protein
MEAGVIFYRRQGDELIGRWSHASKDGRLADERVVGVAAGSFTGTWPVEISDPDGAPMFEGMLESVSFGECFKLTWRGTLLKQGMEADFEGIGCALDEDTLCSSFELVRPRPSPAP